MSHRDPEFPLMRRLSCGDHAFLGGRHSSFSYLSDSAYMIEVHGSRQQFCDNYGIPTGPEGNDMVLRALNKERDRPHDFPDNKEEYEVDEDVVIKQESTANPYSHEAGESSLTSYNFPPLRPDDSDQTTRRTDGAPSCSASSFHSNGTKEPVEQSFVKSESPALTVAMDNNNNGLANSSMLPPVVYTTDNDNGLDTAAIDAVTIDAAETNTAEAATTNAAYADSEAEAAAVASAIADVDTNSNVDAATEAAADSDSDSDSSSTAAFDAAADTDADAAGGSAARKRPVEGKASAGKKAMTKKQKTAKDETEGKTTVEKSGNKGKDEAGPEKTVTRKLEENHGEDPARNLMEE